MDKNDYKKIEKNNKIELGKVIYNIRKEQKMSQEQFAESLGRTSGKVVSRWECGMCRPNDETIILIEKKFNVSLKEFYSSQIQILEKHNNKTILILVIIIIIIILGSLFLIFNREKSYDLVSLDNNLIIEGVYIRKRYISKMYINKIVLKNTEDIKCYSIDTTIKNNDYLIYKYDSIDLFEFEEMGNDTLLGLNEYLKGGNFFFDVNSKTIEKQNNKNFTLIFSCLKNRNRDIEKYKYQFTIN